MRPGDLPVMLANPAFFLVPSFCSHCLQSKLFILLINLLIPVKFTKMNHLKLHFSGTQPLCKVTSPSTSL